MAARKPSGSHLAGVFSGSVRLTLLYALSFTVIGLISDSSRAPAQNALKPTGQSALRAEFVGSSRCITCHAAEHAEWRASQHHDAMQVADDKTVLGNFSGATITKDGIESTFFKKDGKYWVRTDGPAGTLADFEIRYTFGIAPLQQYLIELPGGRMQALGIAWDARPKKDGGQRWYHLYPDRKLAAGDPLHWTGIDQNWNYQCAWCHSTNLRKNFEPATGQFKTTWSEINVGCEACHGPASNHIAWAAKSKSNELYEHGVKGFAVSLDERKGVTWPMGDGQQAGRSIPRTTSKEVHVCAQCHARRQQFSDNPADVGGFLDAFRPLTLDHGLYHVDGQQRDEVYTYGSFVQSKMHAAGVTCSDCHNPHSGKLRVTGNAVCAQCHAPAKFDTSQHHHHASGSKGGECVSCHMPTTTYMGIDDRHDHSMRIPRPDRSVFLGTPNACNHCHTGKTAAWAHDAIKSWYPSPKPGAQDFAEAFDLSDLMAPGAQAALLRIAREGTGSGIARASAMARLGRFPTPQSLELAAQSLKIDDPVVRSAAVFVIASADPDTRRTLLTPLLRDTSRLVRMDAGRALAGEPEARLSPDDRVAFENALDEYVAGQLFNAERPESHANLGGLYRDRQKPAEARAAFETAIAIDPTFIAASISLADTVRMQGDEVSAENILRQSLAANPNSGHIQHALGLSLIRQKRVDDSIEWLLRATENAPDETHFSYVLAVALHDTGKRSEAIAILKIALARRPYDRDVLWALASYEIEAQDFGSALERAQLLNQLEPQRDDVAQLLASLKRKLP